MSAVETRKVKEDEEGQRLDRWFKTHYPELAFGQLAKLLRTGQVRVDGGRAKPGTRLEAGQEIRVPPFPKPTGGAVPKPKPKGPNAKEVERLHDAVLFKDDWVIAVNKWPGLPVQGGSKQEKHLDAMLDALRFGYEERPRLVHRLDKDTSGVLLLARTAEAARKLTREFRGKETVKLYWACVVGLPEFEEARIEAPLLKRPGKAGERVIVDEAEGQSAATDYRVIDRAGDKAAWLELIPLTGRTHQLRAHCEFMGTPILGDGKYGGKGAFIEGMDLPKQMHLHAWRLYIPHPDGKRVLALEAPLPAHMQETWQTLGFDPEDPRRFPEFLQ